MPHSKDPGGGGTETDGTRSALYCSYCYQNGAFTQPDFDVKQMQAFCIEMMQKQGMWRPMAWVLTRRLPRLQRWQV